MKKILLIFTLLLGFSFSVYGQKLIASITEGDTVVEQYDTKFRIMNDTFGSIEISNDEIKIISKGIKTDTYLVFYIEKNNINIICLKEYFDSKPLIYFLVNENRNDEYRIKTILENEEIYHFTISLNHFNDLVNSNTSMVVPTSKNQDWYNIHLLINLLNVYKNQIKDYSIYKQYLK